MWEKKRRKREKIMQQDTYRKTPKYKDAEKMRTLFSIYFSPTTEVHLALWHVSHFK